MFDLIKHLGTSQPALCLVKGYSGIGKSSVILEIQKPIIERGGYFIQGKFDQFKTNIPYFAFIHALQDLIQHILTQSDDKIDYWKRRIEQALGSNAGVITDVIPELKLIIGEPEEVQELDTEQTHNRFSILFQQFITTFASKETPLVIFLDDLQWIDSASQKLIELLLMSNQTRGFLLIGAYRSNEVDHFHPIMSLVEKVKSAEESLTEIEIAPLELPYVIEMLAETLHQTPEQCHDLAQVITAKTEGNPYFINQLLSFLHSEKLLQFNSEKGAWVWDIVKIQNSKVSDNIVTLLINKLQKCSKITQDILMLAACTGHSFNVNLLIRISDYSADVIVKHLQEAIEEGFIMPVDRLTNYFWESTPGSSETLSDEGQLDTLKFPHDRVQQAAYSLITPDRQKEVHLKIGRMLISLTPPDDLEDKIFDIVYQINNAEEIITDSKERAKYAKFNLIAAEKAMKSVAYRTAYDHLNAGLLFLPTNRWELYYDITFPLELHLAECSFITGDFKQAETLFDHILSVTKSDDEKVAVYILKIKLHISTANYIEAIHNARLALLLLGVELPEDTSKLNILKELAIVKFKMFGLSPTTILNMPLINDKRKVEIMNILFILIAPAYLSAKELYAFIVLKGVRLSLDWGLSPYASYFFCAYGIILVILFGNLKEVIKYGNLALSLTKQNIDQISVPATKFLIGAFMMPYDQPIKASIEVLKSSFETGITVGDFIYGVYSLAQMMANQYISSKNLDEMEKDLIEYREFVSKVKAHNRGFMFIGAQQTVLALKGKTPCPWSMDTPLFNEREFFDSLNVNNFPLSLYFIYTYKMQLLFLFGQYSEMLEVAKKSEMINYSVRGHPINMERDFYYALGICQASEKEQKTFKKALKQIRKNLKKAAEQAPANFLHKYLLVEAEVARLKGEKEKTSDYYDQAIESAKAGNYIQNSAIASELFAKFWLGLNKQQLAKYYFLEAHYGYYCWGALAKVKELESTYPAFISAKMGASTLESPQRGPNPETGSLPLDLNSVVKASEILSGELEYEGLIRGLMKIMTENAGAERALLILDKEGKWGVEAEATHAALTLFPDSPLDKSGSLAALSILYYVLRTKESVVLDNASESGLFTTDSYIQSKGVLSVLAFPLIHQTKLIGVIWLENNLATGVFTPGRVEILKLLSSQIANSIENVRLFAKQINLSRELQVSNLKLEDYSQNLERKVYLRTHELKEKNEQLQETLTQIKEMQKKLVQQEKLVSLGAITKTIASEMRAPLNYIFNFAKMSRELLTDLKQGEPAAPLYQQIETNLDKINEHSKLADEIIMTMLEESRTTELVREPTDINKLIRDYADLVYYNYYKKDPQFSLSIETHWDPTLNKIAIVPQNIGRVIYNLIDNACYTTDQKKRENHNDYSPTLTITTRNQENDIEVVIWDNGKGIAPELLSRLFTPFTTTKPFGKGAGMGLSMSHDIIVLEHKGALHIDSVEGEWTKITLNLPK